MSSYICPDCGLLALNLESKPASCEICGWTGVLKFRKILTIHSMKEKSKQTSKFLKLREENKLTFIRLKITGSEDEIFELNEFLLEFFKIDTIKENKKGLIFYIKRKITKEEIEKLNSRKIIKSVSVF